jgi:hypothetical protein
VVGSVQVEIIKLPDTRIIKVNMDNGVVIKRPEKIGICPQQKQLVNGLGIPYLKHIRQKPEAKMCSDKGTQDQKNRYMKVSFFICDQW